MIELKELLRNNDLRVRKYQKKGKATIVDTDNGRYVIKNCLNNNQIFNYLDNREFRCYPDIINNTSQYTLYKYIDDDYIPKEQKMNDLIKFISLLHLKTSYYKKVDETYYKQLYEDINNNILFLLEYYNNIIAIIDSKEYYSPDEYLMARNISIIFYNLEWCQNKLDKWYESISSLKKTRVSVIHNNLKLEHYFKNILISWDKAKIDTPIFDIYKLYMNHSNDFEIKDLLLLYEKNNPLKEEEKNLLNILVQMPKKIKLSNNHYDNCVIIKNEIKRLLKCKDSVNEKNSKKNY